MKFNKKFNTIFAIDSAVVFFSNLIVILISRLLPVPKSPDPDWMEANSKYMGLAQFFSFLIPSIFIVLFAYGCKSESRKRRISRFPFIFSLLGISGWLVNLIFKQILITTPEGNMPVNRTVIITSSLFYMVLASLFTFTLSFFTTETLHRKVFLPEIFPQGHIPSRRDIFKPSVGMVSTIFYISSAIFPLTYLFACYLVTCKNNNIKIHWNNLIILAILIFIGFILKLFFTDYVSDPVKKLIAGTKRIKNGDYNSKVDFVSDDDFGELTDTFNDMAASIKTKSDKILAIQNSIIRGMAVMVESRDNSTGGHINRTSACVRVFARHLIDDNIYPGVTEDFYGNVVKAAPMHDLGKIAVDDAILRKNGKFTDEEYGKMKKHSEEGARIVTHVLKEVDDEDFKRIAVNVAHFHHEKWDGNGYPAKLSGEAIPFEARIMALADVFDALVSKRCYKEEFSYDKAFGIINDSLGTHFDPDLGREFLKCRPQLESLYDHMAE